MIIVTGANGFIGSAIVWQLNEKRPEKVIATDTLSLQERPTPLENRTVDQFLLKNEIWGFLKNNAAQIQWVIHMGACSSTTETDVAFLQENNTEYTQKLFQWCTENKTPFIYASSAAVYGDGQNGFSDRDKPENFEPLNPYGESKAAFDRWAVKQEKAPPNWYGLRFFNVYGPGEEHKESMASVVFKAFHQIKKTGELKLFRSHRPDYQDGEQERDFVYVKDITRWILELMEKKPESGIYNMGFGQPRTWIDLASAVFENLEVPVKIDWIDMPSEVRDQYQYTTCAQTEKWKANQLSAPQWSLEEGIKDYVSFLKSGKRYL